MGKERWGGSVEFLFNIMNLLLFTENQVPFTNIQQPFSEMLINLINLPVWDSCTYVFIYVCISTTHQL